MRLHDFEVLSFDCYGTLIDWETGIFAALAPLLDELPTPPSREDALARFAHFEGVQQRATPTKRYSDILAIVYKRLAEAWGQPATWEAAEAFGASVADWPAFPDSAEALAALKQRYKLVILSNVDNASFAASNARLAVTFDAVFTAEETGVYKPDRAGFAYMLARLGERGIGKGAILHTAQGLFHDHATAAELGLARCFIDRHAARPGAGATAMPDGLREPDFRFESMAALVAAVRTGGGVDTRMQADGPISNEWPKEGGCRCGAVRLRVSAPPLLTMACHCTGCQRMSASAFSLSAAIPTDAFAVTRGEPVRGGAAEGPIHHFFCPKCMSWLFTRAEGMDWFVNLRATMLDDARWFSPFIETWTAEKLPWASTGAVHSFAGFPPPDAYESLTRDYAAARTATSRSP